MAAVDEDIFGATVRWADGAAVVEVRGELDLATAPVLADRLDEVVTAAPSRVVVDLGPLSFMDLRGVKVLAEARAALPESNCEIVIRRPNRLAHKVLRLVGLDGLCDVSPGSALDPTTTAI